MAVLVWVMMGIAIWHFTIFFPDRFWGGIVGAFVGAVVGAVVFGFIARRLQRHRRTDDTDVAHRARGRSRAR